MASFIASLQCIGPAFTLMTQATKAIDYFQSFSSLPEEGFLLWKLMEATEAPLELASGYDARYATRGFVTAAVELTRRVIGQCEEVIQRDDDEERPDTPDSWTSWLNHTKDGVQRKEMLPKLSQRLVMCQQALQLAFASVALRQPGFVPNAPFDYIPDAVDLAKRVIQAWEMGRWEEKRLAAGSLYLMGGSTTRVGEKRWEHMGDVEVSLSTAHIDDDKKALQLRFDAVEEFDLGYGDGEGSDAASDSSADDADVPSLQEHVMFLDANTKIRRCFLSSQEGIEPQQKDVGKLSYHIGSYMLCYTAVPWFRNEEASVHEGAAEVFEAILYLAKLKDRTKTLAEVAPDVEDFKFIGKMARELGGYVQTGDQPTPDRFLVDRELVTPMSRMAIRDRATPGSAAARGTPTTTTNASTPLRGSRSASKTASTVKPKQ